MGLEVIGPGFGRTGTNSLRRALEHLGFGPCHHMYELGDHPEQLPNWEALARGDAVDWDDVFAGYRAQVDWPGARFWRELCAYYPDAKVVLSVREPQGWYDSMEKTIVPHLEKREESNGEGRSRRLLMNNKLISQQTFDGRISDRAYAIDEYNANIAEVQAEIASERLLTFDVREGWGPLCAFLGVDVPDADFPNTNSTKEFNNKDSNNPERTV